MNLVLSDTSLPADLPSCSSNRYVDLSQLTISPCIGCFGCWVKTPGRCVIRDDAPSVYPLIAQSKRVLYVSRIRFGSYDVRMKTMLERSIPIQQAFIRLHQGETHHIPRAVEEKDAVILAYGAQSVDEQEVFSRLIERNSRNMLFKTYRIAFVTEEELTQTIYKEVAAWDAC